MKHLFFLLILALLTHLGAEVIEPFKIRYQKNVNGATEIIGNTLLTAPKNSFKSGQPDEKLSNDKLAMQYVSIDASKRNASSADLRLKEESKVLFAGLYWGARSSASKTAKGTLEIKTPVGGYQKIAASSVYSAPDENYYSAFADVTRLVIEGKSGSYTVANVDALTGADCFAGWAMVVVYENATMPLRSMTLFDGYAIVPPTVDIVASGFHAPKEGLFNAYLSAIAFEGDYESKGDALSLNGTPVGDALNDTDNFFNSRITKNGTLVTTKTPNYTNQLGFDIKQIDVTGLVKNGDTKADVSFITNKDYYQPVALVFVTDYATDIGHTQMVAPQGPYKHGDRLTLTSTLENKQTASAYKLRYTTDLMGAFSYVPGSMKQDGIPIEAIVTDEKLEAIIEKLDANSTLTLSFDVQIKSPAHVGFDTNVTLQSALNYHLEELGVRIFVPSDNDPESSGAEPTRITMAKASKSLALLHTQTTLPAAPLWHGSKVVIRNEIANLSTLDAQKAVYATQLPQGTSYVPNSFTVDNKPVAAQLNQGLLQADVGAILPQQTVTITYEIELASFKVLPYASKITMPSVLNYEVSRSGVKSALGSTYTALDGTQGAFKLEMIENVRLIRADKLYAEGNYTGAAALYDELFFEEMNALEYNQKLARASHKALDYDTAIASYDRLLILDDRPMYRFELAEVYIDLRMLGDAKTSIQNMKNLTPDEKQKRTELLARIEDLRPRHTLLSVFQLGLAYDDNINASPGTTALADYYANELNATLPSDTPDRIGDGFYNFMGSLVWLYDVGAPARYYFKNSVTLLSQNYLTQSSFNLLFGKLSIAPGYKMANYDISVPLEADHVMFGGNNLVTSYGLAPSITYVLNPDITTNAYVKYQQKQYVQANLKGRDNRNIIAGGKVDFKKSDALISITYRYQDAQKAQTSSDTFVDYKAHSLGGDYTMTLPDRYELKGNYTLRLLGFSDPISQTNNTARFDALHNISLTASKTFFQNLKLNANYTHTANSSNYDLIIYNKNKIQFNAQMGF